MPYVDLAGLSRYASRQKDRLERDCALLRDMQWLRTEKAGAVSLWPVGGTPLDVSVDFLFSETGPASGDKGPDNPSTITGVSSVKVTRCGDNLCDGGRQVVNFSTFSDGWFGGVVDNSNGTSAKYAYVYYKNTATISSDKNYCAVVETENSADINVGGYTAAPNAPALRAAGGMSVAVLGSTKVKVDLEPYDTVSPFCMLRCTTTVQAGETKTIKFRVAVLQCSASEVDLSSYVYSNPRDTYNIPLGNTYYGGTLDVASGVMTVTWVGKVFDGTEPFRVVGVSSGSTRFVYDLTVYNLPVAIGGENNSICSHAVFVGSIEGVWGNFNVTTTGSSSYFYMQDKNEVIASLENYVSWVAAQYSAGTPLTMAYKIAAPYTVQLDPVSISALAQIDKYTPRLNTVYTDAQAVQVGYIKSPIRDEYELQQAITAQGGNV